MANESSFLGYQVSLENQDILSQSLLFFSSVLYAWHGLLKPGCPTCTLWPALSSRGFRTLPLGLTGVGFLLLLQRVAINTVAKDTFLLFRFGRSDSNIKVLPGLCSFWRLQGSPNARRSPSFLGLWPLPHITLNSCLLSHISSICTITPSVHLGNPG